MAEQLVAVVNNDTDFLELMNDLLSLEGYRTIICREGDRAYGMIKETRPDLVILDVRLDHAEQGWTILELVRLDPATAQIPVIVCSADARFLREKATTLHGLRCDTLEKPFDLNTLLEKVARALHDGQGGDS
jgi:DNA-binding NtrC family response regulator